MFLYISHLHPILLKYIQAEVPEWSIGAVCKTAAPTGSGGSNPPLSTENSEQSATAFGGILNF